MHQLTDGLKRRLGHLAGVGVARGLPPGLLGYRWVARERLHEHMGRQAAVGDAVRTLHSAHTASNPLPCNIERREMLPDDRGWWGFSMRDVPVRRSEATVLATLSRARVLPWMDPDIGEFRPAILTRQHRSLELREISFRPVHGRLLRAAGPPARLERATWIAERVYHNHSHWLTAHLPKLLLLRDMDHLDDVLLPPKRTAVMDASMRRLGLDPESFRSFDLTRPLDVTSLDILATDRFHPRLLRPVRDAFAARGRDPVRKVYISRSDAERRRLVNEDEVWPLLRKAGFERVHMEGMGFDEQVNLMQETRVLFAPHGAGLTNMMFCHEGTNVVEIADLGFPNPNFYALASAMGLRYWLLAGDGLGDVHPLEKDLRVEPRLVEEVLEQLPA
jgi:hypothetical protein